MAVMPTKCPACGGETRVRALQCPECGTEVQGDFPLSRLAQLSGEHLTFLDAFLRCRGSLKEVGAQLGISYPTARNRLDAMLSALGYAEARDTRTDRLEILMRLKSGEITTNEALNLLQGGLDND
ncbi:MAG: DUF2089 domain-containing protein [Oscillospiraceae bacterium]|jgi:hypothetical protein|nr:DUF2089 domain-containing protein [Oscillospiraceae bacterium]